jgi:hypothetical protein
MATNIRPTFVVDKKPLIIWEPVGDSLWYQLKLVRKSCPDNPIWQIAINENDLVYDLKTDEKIKYLQFRYSETKYDHLSPLEELIPYLIIGEAHSKEGVMQAMGEFILLEKTTRDYFEELKKEIEQTSDANNLKKIFAEFSESFFMNQALFGTGPGQWRFPGVPCHQIQFSYSRLDKVL